MKAWVLAAISLGGGCQLASLHTMSAPRHYLTVGGGAGIASSSPHAATPDGVVEYHYTPRVLYRTGLALRSTRDVLDAGPDLELDLFASPLRVVASGGYSLGYSSANTWFVGGGLRWQFLSSRFRFATNAQPQESVSLEVSYSARFGDQPDVIWLSLLFEYVPRRSE